MTIATPRPGQATRCLLLLHLVITAGALQKHDLEKTEAVQKLDIQNARTEVSAAGKAIHLLDRDYVFGSYSGEIYPEPSSSGSTDLLSLKGAGTPKALYILATDGSMTCPVGYQTISDIAVCQAGFKIAGVQYTWNTDSRFQGSMCYTHLWPGSGCYSWRTTLYFSNCKGRPLAKRSHNGVCQKVRLPVLRKNDVVEALQNDPSGKGVPKDMKFMKGDRGWVTHFVNDATTHKTQVSVQWERTMAVSHSWMTVAPDLFKLAQLDFDIGGTETQFGKGHATHPELVKSETCNQKGKCLDCTSSSKCWHGETHNNKNVMTITVPAGSSYTRYVASVHMHCSSSMGGAWRLWLTTLVSATLVLQLNDRKWPDIKRASSRPYKFHVVGRSNNRLRVELLPSDQNKKAQGSFALKAFNVDPSIQSCLDMKACLPILSKQTGPSYTLRNNHVCQLQCLDGQLAKGTDISAICDKWLACVPDNNEKILKVVLRAMGRAGTTCKTGSAQLLNIGEASHDMKGGAAGETCIDPAADDAETWDCECQDQMVEACGGNADERCLRLQMCKHPKVCEAWKKMVDCDGILFKSQLLERSESDVAKNVSQKPSSGSLMEDSLKGKCVV